MFDFLSTESYYEFPSLSATIYALLLSFVLSTIIAFIHKITFKGVSYNWGFFQALVLSSIVSAMVMMAIGDSLARGLGMLGALAIIRFRTLLRDPRNIIFIFASLSIGISSGVYGFNIAISGTFIFCVIALLLYYYTSRAGSEKEFSVVFSLAEKDALGLVEKVMMENCKKISKRSLTHNKSGLFRYEYLISLKNEKTIEELFNSLDGIDKLLNVRMFNQEETESV